MKADILAGRPLFLTQRGVRWVRGTVKDTTEGDGQTEGKAPVVFSDAVAQEFRKVLKRLNLKQRIVLQPATLLRDSGGAAAAACDQLTIAATAPEGIK